MVQRLTWTVMSLTHPAHRHEAKFKMNEASEQTSRTTRKCKGITPGKYMMAILVDLPIENGDYLIPFKLRRSLVLGQTRSPLPDWADEQRREPGRKIRPSKLGTTKPDRTTPARLLWEQKMPHSKELKQKLLGQAGQHKTKDHRWHKIQYSRWKDTSQQQPRFNERKTILSGDTLRQNSFQELTDSRLQKTIHDLYCIVSDRITPSHTVSVHLETSMTDKLHFILNAVECVLDSRTAKQITVLAEMNATGSSGEINYGKGLFYLRQPRTATSPTVTSPLPHCYLTETSLQQNLTSSYYSYPFVASCCSPSEEFQASHSVRFQLTCPDKYQRHISTLRHEKRH